jgi:hypothetical protein
MIVIKKSDGGIEINDYGISLNINPKFLFTAAFSDESRVLIDNMIEFELKKALSIFRDSIENIPELRDKLYKKVYTSALIKKIALVERDLVCNLHTDGECIKLSDDLVEIREFAYSVWRYNSYYGYKKPKKYTEENEEV